MGCGGIETITKQQDLKNYIDKGINMKRLLNLIVLGVLLFLICIVAFTVITTNIKHEELKKQAREYLYNKYSQSAIFNHKITYYDSIYFFSDTCFQNENIRFQVRYNTVTSQFEDDFIEESIENEIRTLIENKLELIGYGDVEVIVGFSYGSTKEISERLYSKFKSLRRIPKVEDVKEIVRFSHITLLRSKGQYSISEKNEMIRELSVLNLPIDNISFGN